MNLLQGKIFRRAHKKTKSKDPEATQVITEASNGKEKFQAEPVVNANDTSGDIEDDDDDFITEEVKRRLKELRKNSFMVEIPEEDVDMEASSSSEWQDSEAEENSSSSVFENVYDKYSEKMLFFDKVTAEQMPEAGSPVASKKTARSTSKKLSSTFRHLSLKKQESLEEAEYLQDKHHDPYQELETAYVAQVCLTWEALHCQYKQFRDKMLSTEFHSVPCYARFAEQLQQFQVLLQRFIENEPFEPGRRPEIYARARVSMPKLLQVPRFQGADRKETSEESDSESHISVSDILLLIQDSILTFHQFLKADKKKKAGLLNVLGGHNHVSDPLHQIKVHQEKKKMKVKELFKKKKAWKKKSWLESSEEIELLLGLIDIRVVSRVLRMGKINEEQLRWCREKIGKLDFPGGHLQRDTSPLLFPC